MIIKRWIIYMYIIPLFYFVFGFSFTTLDTKDSLKPKTETITHKTVKPVKNFSDDYSVEMNEEKASLTLDSDTDLGLYFYRQELTREKVEKFYSNITGSEEIARLILQSAANENIPVTLAFALAWAESRFNPLAVNQNHSSIDRGLFQLNSVSFPKLTEQEFFDPSVNVSTGLKYLRYCLNVGGNEVAGLAMYNAGRRRVTTSGAPKMTLDYISKVLSYSDYLHGKFENEMDLTRMSTSSFENGTVSSVRYVLNGETYF